MSFKEKTTYSIIDWVGIFPRRPAISILFGYVGLNIIQGILATLDQSNEYIYNITTVLLLIELTKLFISSILFIYKQSVEAFANGLAQNIHVLRFYAIPAILYCAYNNLVLSNSTFFSLSMYTLLLQLRIPFTALVFQIVFRKYLTKRQWISLLLLTVGCMLRQLQFSELYYNHVPAIWFYKSVSSIVAAVALIAVATICHEHLLKHCGAQVDVHLQNVFLSLQQVVFQVAMMLLLIVLAKDEFSSDLGDLRIIFKDPYLVLMILTNAIVGLVGAFFLKYMNTISRMYGCALEIFIGPLSGYVLFGLPVYASTALSVAIVSVSTFLYALQPIVNKRPGIKGHKRMWRILDEERDVERI